MNYRFIAEAIEWYSGRGFKHLEVDWMVSDEAVAVTKPPTARSLHTPLGHLVASGEQSFIALMQRKELKPGLYSCCTPCFRDEPILDELHRNWFVKVELISAYPKRAMEDLCHTICTANDFFRHYLPVEMFETEEGYDISANGIELGSYGIRTHEDMILVYGTGVAEPRLSQALNRS